MCRESCRRELEHRLFVLRPWDRMMCCHSSQCPEEEPLHLR